MNPLLLNPRLRDLVAQAEAIDAVIEAAQSRGEDAGAAEAAMVGILRELGRHVLSMDRDARALARQDDDASPVTADGGFTAEAALEELDAGSWDIER